MTAFPALLRAASAALLLAGPAVAGLGSLPFPIPPLVSPAAAAEAGPFVPGLTDVPVMPGLASAESEPLVFDKPGGRIVQAVLAGRVPRPAVLAFYDQTLPQLGWRRTRDRIYVREGEELRLEFPAAAPDTAVRFILTPR
ncbi:hypothetical protein [Azospirillum picis]|uniref:Uncharacterized protein n=1 Tax=Azospirillum picis TaxID=488438 RepID=A0ABU0MUS5_9PROT|nr:hypothetical protein [Azospirillum picis]MBP2301901.1 hypothetical protein [Azospirillum picis]MDQ0537253.1 hypothetical protein [Azospirillum picis]